MYDSNVIELGNNTTAPNGISGKGDSRIVVQPSGSYSLIHTDKIDAGIEGSGYFAFQFDLNSFDVASYQIGPYINYRVAQDIFASLRYGYNYVTLGHDSYLSRNIVTPQLTFIEPKLGYTSLYYQFQARQFADSFEHQFPLPPPPSNFDVKDNLDRDGQNHTFGLSQGINLPEIFRGAGNANMEIDYRLTDQEAVGGDYDGLFNQLGATLYTPLPFGKVRGDFGVAYEFDDYRHQNSLDTAFDRHDARKDQQWVLTAGLTRELFKGCSLRVDYSYTTNDSNVRFGDEKIFSFDRNQVGVRLIYNF